MSSLLVGSLNNSGSVGYRNDQSQDPLLPKVIKFAKSLLLGTSGTFEYQGNSVYFEGNSFNRYDPPLDIVKKILGDYFKLLVLRYLYTFVHEMGHATAYKLVTQNPDKIKMTIEESGYEGGCNSITYDLNSVAPKSTVLGKNIILAAGPVTSVTVASFIFFLGARLQRLIPSVGQILKMGATANILVELRYFLNSSWCRDEGDWGRILNENKIHYSIASSLFLTIVLLNMKAYLKAVLSKFK